MFVRRFARLIVAVVMGANTVARAQTPCPPAATPLGADELQAQMREATDRGFLWRLTRDGRSSYLYGTLHVGRRTWVVPGPTVRQALQASDVVALELDITDPEVRRRLAERLDAKSVPALAPKLAARVDALAQAQCVSATLLAPLRPEMQVITLSALAARGEGLDPSYGIDLVLGAMARAAGKAVLSLESPEQQAEALTASDARERTRLVERALNDLESGKTRATFARLADVWAESRLTDMQRYEQWCDCSHSGAERALYKRLIDTRNPPLARNIEAVHAGGKSVFAAVGALHMVGDQALTDLLLRRGFKIERLVPP